MSHIYYFISFPDLYFLFRLSPNILSTIVHFQPVPIMLGWLSNLFSPASSTKVMYISSNSILAPEGTSVM